MAGERYGRAARELNMTMGPSAPRLRERLRLSTRSTPRTGADGIQSRGLDARGRPPAYVAVRRAFRRLEEPLR
jgi:hypothetical protein